VTGPARLTFVRRHGGWPAPALGVAAGWYGETLYWYLAQEPRELNPSYLPLWATFVAWPAVGLVLSWYSLGLAALLPAAAGYGLWWLACARPELRRRPTLDGVRAEVLDRGRWWVRKDGYWWRHDPETGTWERGAPLPRPIQGSTRQETWALRRDQLLREQNKLLRQAIGESEAPAERRRISIDQEDAGLLLSFCEPGSALDDPTITPDNYRRFVVAQAEAERQRRLERARPGGAAGGSSAGPHPP
jgi:hypothetical protein